MTASVNVVSGGVTTAYSAAMYLACGAQVTFNLTSPSSPTAVFVDVASRSGALKSSTPLGTATTFSMAMPAVPDVVTVTFTAYGGTGYTGGQTLTLTFNVASGQVPVQDFGAVGDGVTDDSGAVQNAFTALAGSGLSLYFPAGTYLCTAVAPLNPGVPCVFGAGASVTGTNANAVLNSGALPYYCRAVMTTFVGGAYVGSGTATLTAGANGAFGTHDGVSSLAVGDVVHLQGGSLNSQAITAKDTGPWVISSLGAVGAKWVLKRPAWWPVGAGIPLMAQLTMGPEGTLFGGTRWSSWAATGKVVSTDDPLFFPDRVATQVTLAASTVTVSTVPIRSATLTLVHCGLAAVGGTTTSTVGYGPIAAPTAGYVGTASLVIDAVASGQTKNGGSDTSIVNVLITNRAA